MQPNHKPITFGVMADSHIPDRATHLPTALLESLRAAQVDRILHAGDASSWKVVRQLEQVAPVTIVQGNRDWMLLMRNPRHQTFTVNGLQITLAHGHRSMLHYLIDKWDYIREGYHFSRYYDHLSKDFPDSDVIIFGHTHHQTVKWVGRQLLFNPGAAYPCHYNNYKPQFGILRITPGGDILTECHHIY